MFCYIAAAKTHFNPGLRARCPEVHRPLLSEI
jgi:hypothetical protein